MKMSKTMVSGAVLVGMGSVAALAEIGNAQEAAPVAVQDVSGQLEVILAQPGTRSFTHAADHLMPNCGACHQGT